MKKFVHVAGAVIENKDGFILCAQRSSTMTLPLLWEFPGGKIEEGENAPQALIREINEELGCTIEVFEQVADTTHEYDTFIVRLETYKSNIVAGTPIAREHAQLRWLSRDELHTLDWAAADVPAVEALQQKGV